MDVWLPVIREIVRVNVCTWEFGWCVDVWLPVWRNTLCASAGNKEAEEQACVPKVSALLSSGAGAEARSLATRSVPTMECSFRQRIECRRAPNVAHNVVWRICVPKSNVIIAHFELTISKQQLVFE